jgi:hypothetical protein
MSTAEDGWHSSRAEAMSAVHDEGTAAAFAVHEDPDAPSSIEAMRRLQSPDDVVGFEASLKKELNGHESYNTWTEVDRSEVPHGTNIITSKVFFVKKPLKDGTFKYKCRLVARGFGQDETQYWNTESPVPSDVVNNVFLSVVAGEDLDAVHVDVRQAFVNSPIDTEIFMRLPRGLGSKIVRLNKALYGLKQASRCWHDTLRDCTLEWDGSEAIKEPGAAKFKACDGELCVYNLICDGKEGRPLMWSSQRNLDGSLMHHRLRLLIYVDDLIIAFTKDNPLAKHFVDYLSSKFEITKDPLVWFLNCKIQRDRKNRAIYLSQERHIANAIRQVMNCEPELIKPNSLPFQASYQPDATGCADADEAAKMDREGRLGNYRSNVAKYLWGFRTRPGLMFPINCLCAYMPNPGLQHEKGLVKVSRYCAGTLNLGIKLAPTDWTVSATSDSDWAANKTDRASISAHIVRIGRSFVKGYSKKQRIIALSTMEAELIALCECSKTVAYIRRLMASMGYPQPEPTKIGVDNQSAISVSESVMIAWKNRHIPLRYFKVRQLIKDNAVELYYVPSADNDSDFFTKALPQDLFDKHRSSMVFEIPNIPLETDIPLEPG